MKVTEDKVNDVTAKVTKVAAGLQKQANGTWDKLETVFEDRVERALTRLGVPTNKEITVADEARRGTDHERRVADARPPRGHARRQGEGAARPQGRHGLIGHPADKRPGDTRGRCPDRVR